MLAADDEPGIIHLLKDYFEMQDYQVIEAENGMEVLEKISQNPDIILLDVNMPGLDGFEVCERIRAHVSCPILFLTAKIEEADRIKGLMLGGDDYRKFGLISSPGNLQCTFSHFLYLIFKGVSNSNLKVSQISCFFPNYERK